MFLENVRNPTIWQWRNFASISKRIEDKKIHRLTSLRNAIMEIFQQQQTKSSKSQFDWLEVRDQLKQRGLHFPSNFEFALLSSFDSNLKEFEQPETPILQITSNTKHEPLSKELFEAICSFVSQSSTIKINKIASTRFCVFLSQYPQYLNDEQLDFIRQTAMVLVKDSILIHPIIIDIMQSLVKSSKGNCQLALQLMPEFLAIQSQGNSKKNNFSLKLELLNILFGSLVEHRLSEELYHFLMANSSLIQVDQKLITDLINITASIPITSKKFTRQNLLEMLQCFREMFFAVQPNDLVILIDKILKQKLGYTNIQDVRINQKTGQCDCCGQRLSGLSLAEFSQLKTNFKSIIFDQNDQYLMDNLSEYQFQLMEFESKVLIDDEEVLAGLPPKYDMIIDGLNIGYRTSSSIVKDKSGLRQYAKVFKTKSVDNQIVTIIETNRLLYKYKRLLLIGRQHMKTWFQLKRMCRNYSNIIDQNLLLNGTRDDNYILYAAIQHPETMILSGDYFRDHRNKFEECFRQHDGANLGRLFQRWLRQRQIKVGNGMQLKYPNKYDVRFHFHQMDDRLLPIIHIPVIVKLDPYNEDHEIAWICARP